MIRIRLTLLNISKAIVTLSLLSLAGCGFHFVKSNPDAHITGMKIILETNNKDIAFNETLISYIKDKKIIIQEKQTPETKFLVQTGPINKLQNIIDLSGNSLAGNYTETYSVVINVTDTQENSTVKNKNYILSSKGSFNSNATQTLSQTTQIEQIKRKAYKDLANKIIEKLNQIILERKSTNL